MTCPRYCACGGFGGVVLASYIPTKSLLNGKQPTSEWRCHTCKRSTPASEPPQHEPGCLYVADELAWNAVFHNAVDIPKEYPHASDATNVGKYYWRAALQYERERVKP